MLRKQEFIFLRLFLLALFFLLVTGCAKRPQVELEIVRAEVTKAYTHGAKSLAAEDYAAATAALKKAEDLVYQEQYGQAREILNQALLSAAKAVEMAQIKAQELESQRLREKKVRAAKHKKAHAVVKAKRKVVVKKSRVVVVKRPSKKPVIVLRDRVTVSVGETLFSLSSRRDIYGEPLLWPLIYKANRDQIKDPQQIFEGQVLIIPRDKDEREKESARKEARESELFPR
ncbi:MAG: LysM peptidoglycan-binding domain-containing protein [Geopsychrobacter sp.]|nr:LysM peptidoglycan-binding domain-containing protein [Geopsychrobacter sp.]